MLDEDFIEQPLPFRRQLYADDAAVVLALDALDKSPLDEVIDNARRIPSAHELLAGKFAQCEGADVSEGFKHAELRLCEAER